MANAMQISLVISLSEIRAIRDQVNLKSVEVETCILSFSELIRMAVALHISLVTSSSEIRAI